VSSCPHVIVSSCPHVLMSSRAKGFQHQRMTNGAMNVEIGNPAYKIYEGEPDEDAGELLDADFTLDPDKVLGGWGTYEQLNKNNSTLKKKMNTPLYIVNLNRNIVTTSRAPPKDTGRLMLNLVYCRVCRTELHASMLALS